MNDYTLDDIAYYIASYCRKWGRMGGQYKEKYGTVRYYALFGIYNLYHFLYPHYMWVSWSNAVRKIDDAIFGFLFSKILNASIMKWQKYIYGRAYLNALKKWPEYRYEILCCADVPEYIPGVTRQEGKLTHILGKDGEVIATWEKL